MTAIAAAPAMWMTALNVRTALIAMCEPPYSERIRKQVSSARSLISNLVLAVVFAAGCDGLFTVEATPSENFVLASLETTADLRVSAS